MYRIHIGYEPGIGRDQWRYFTTLDAAQEAANKVLAVTGDVLPIECDHSNWNDYFEKCDDCGYTLDQWEQEGLDSLKDVMNS